MGKNMETTMGISWEYHGHALGYNGNIMGRLNAMGYK
jgi:hypothetical protein